MSRTPRRKLLRGVVLLRRTDLAAVREVLDAFGATVEVRIIQPTSEDVASLRKAAR